jgi:bifunctional DNA-binding transcriptional regulator/antitoxin component of YhaV-PrlF toxin-antitoxin module
MSTTPNEIKHYRSQIVGPKRQLTIPDSMMKDLRLEPGDFLEFMLRDRQIEGVNLLKPLPIDSLPEEVLNQIRRANAEFERGAGEKFSSPNELKKKLARKAARTQVSTAAAAPTRYRIQIVGAKRQITVPERMMLDLALEPGDFLEFEIVGTTIRSVSRRKLVAIDRLPDKVLALIEEASSQLKQGKARMFSGVQEIKAVLRGSEVSSLKEEKKH